MKNVMVKLLNKKIALFFSAAIILAAVSCSGPSGINYTGQVIVDEGQGVLKIKSSFEDIRSLYSINDTLVGIISNNETRLRIYNNQTGDEKKQLFFSEEENKRIYNNIRKKFNDDNKFIVYDSLSSNYTTFGFYTTNSFSTEGNYFYLRGGLMYGLQYTKDTRIIVGDRFILKININNNIKIDRLYPLSEYYLTVKNNKIERLSFNEIYYNYNIFPASSPFTVFKNNFYFFTVCDTPFIDYVNDKGLKIMKINFEKDTFEFINSPFLYVRGDRTSQFYKINSLYFSKNINGVYFSDGKIVTNVESQKLVYKLPGTNDFLVNFYISPDEKQVNTLFYSRKGFYYKMFNNGKLTDSLFVGTRDSVYGVDLYKNTGVALVRKGENFYFKNYKFE